MLDDLTISDLKSSLDFTKELIQNRKESLDVWKHSEKDDKTLSNLISLKSKLHDILFKRIRGLEKTL